MGDGYTDAEGRPMSGMPYRAMEEEHARRMLRTTLEVREDREVWQTGGNYTERIVCIAATDDAAKEIVHRWNSYASGGVSSQMFGGEP